MWLFHSECSNDDWRVVGVWNSEQLRREKSEIHRELVQRLIRGKYDKVTRGVYNIVGANLHD